jgi:ATP-dependent RNA/DNA helicase IGHMBP2
LRSELKSIEKEVVQREKIIREGIMNDSKIVFATCAGAASYLFRNSFRGFDYAIFHEGAQSLEAVCWIPILLSPKIILAGDRCQLPPAMKSKEAEQRGVSISLFEAITAKASLLQNIGLADHSASIE